MSRQPEPQPEVDIALVDLTSAPSSGRLALLTAEKSDLGIQVHLISSPPPPPPQQLELRALGAVRGCEVEAPCIIDPGDDNANGALHHEAALRRLDNATRDDAEATQARLEAQLETMTQQRNKAATKCQEYFELYASARGSVLSIARIHPASERGCWSTQAGRSR